MVDDEEVTLSSPKEGPKRNREPAAPPVRVNDVYWEQFLIERPGSSDNEEASSNYRSNPYEEQEDKRPGHGLPRNAKNMEHFSLCAAKSQNFHQSSNKSIKASLTHFVAL
ncbi:hypothetical protein REPUB_Repub15cG0083300 [Reevesia pubescens]